MSYSIRKITNGVVVGGNTGENNEFEEHAFRTSETGWEKAAKKHVTDNKAKIVDQIEKNAHDQIDRFNKEFTSTTTTPN